MGLSGTDGDGDVDEATVDALGKLSAALESVERARGHLYGFHQLSGKADFELGDAVEALRRAGHEEMASRLEEELVGRKCASRPVELSDHRGVRRHVLVGVPAMGAGGPRRAGRRAPASV